MRSDKNSSLWQDSLTHSQRAAAMAKLRRVCLPKPGSGALDVPKSASDKFKNKGAGRDELLNFLVNDCKGRQG